MLNIINIVLIMTIFKNKLNQRENKHENQTFKTSAKRNT